MCLCVCVVVVVSVDGWVVLCRVVSFRVGMVWSDGVCCVAGCMSVVRCERIRHVTSMTVPKTEICHSTKITSQ